jgi:GT2 family glycosyltransferase
LRPCLQSVLSALPPVVYVDSGSTDGSAEIAEEMGVSVVRLRDGRFTAARGRRAGLEYLRNQYPGVAFVQFVDGDCELDPNWLAGARRFLDADSSMGAVVGRLREKHPERSLLIRLVDVEWDLPVGDIDVVGGISLMRVEAIEEAGGWCDGMIAGEELDLSVRMRSRGWKLHRLPAAMCTHDIGISRLREFWKRSFRSGYSYASLSFLHAKSGPRRWRSRAVGNIAYGVVLPGMFPLALTPVWPIGVAAVLLYLSLLVRFALGRLRRGDPPATAIAYGAVITWCKTGAALGVLRYLVERWSGRRTALIEYRAPAAPTTPERTVGT